MRGLVQLSRQRGEAVPLRSLYDPGLDLQLTSRRALGESEIHEPNPARAAWVSPKFGRPSSASRRGLGRHRNLREVLVDRLGDRATLDFTEVRR